MIEKNGIKEKHYGCGPLSASYWKKTKKKIIDRIVFTIKNCVSKKRGKKREIIIHLDSCDQVQFCKSNLWIKVSTAIMLTVCENYVFKDPVWYDG